MATENHWLHTNIRDRLTNPESKFIVTLDYVDYQPISFADASKRVVEKLVTKFDKIYIPLSGGMDSEYVFNCFIDHKFTPIIVDTPANKKESAYAFRRCLEANIKPVIIEKTEKEMVETYYNEVYKKLNGKGIYSIAAFIAAKYADDHNAVAVIGEHGFGGFNEWDFYNDALIHEENSIYFYMYDVEIFSAMIRQYKQSCGENHQLFKHKLYKIPIRPKMKFEYSESTLNEVIYKLWNQKR